VSGKKSTGDHSNGHPSYFLQQERYTGEMSIARQYAGQKVWPRAVYVRQARFYHSARLRWSAIERRRGPLEDILIDDLAEWSMWHYPSGEGELDEVTTLVLTQARQFQFSSGIQSDNTGSFVFSTLMKSAVLGCDIDFKLQNFDGIRRRCLPKFYKALEPGTEDDRMKGALWALNVPVFGT